MKRDFNLIREIMLNLAATPPATVALVVAHEPPGDDCDFWTLCFEGRRYDEVTDHLSLMEEVGLIKLGVIKTSHTRVETVTMKGHDFIAMSSDRVRWDKAIARLPLLSLPPTWDNLLTVLN